jgi:hypothetical protein
MSLERELQVRRDRLAELDRREGERPSRPAPDAAAMFWHGVDVLLGNDQVARDDEAGKALLDDLAASRKRSLRAEITELSSWLDDA